MERVRVGIIGCGAISGIYFHNMFTVFDRVLDVRACSDLIPERAEAKGKEYGVAVRSTEEILADPEIEAILNITQPYNHYNINVAALKAGKCAHVEKPLAICREDGAAAVKLAHEKGLLLGGAPDTFMGAGIQTCRKLIDDGWIGEPTGATAFMAGNGPEGWHPDPEFFYEVGGGPMFDMGPYYLTALISLLGPVSKVTGMTRITFPERTITSQPKFGKCVKVEIPTHIAGILEFGSGAIGTLLTSFDVMGGSTLPRIEIYGSEGTLIVPDPNTFGGPVLVNRKGGPGLSPVPLTHSYADNSRGLGIADMAMALRTGRKYRCSSDLTFHVLDCMVGFHDSADAGRHLTLESTCERPDPMPMNLIRGELD